MHRYSNHKIWFAAILLLLFVTGCGDPDKNANSGNPGDPFTPPTVTSVTPPDGNVDVCPNANPLVITATFSKPMNPATISLSTFTLSGPSGNIDGTVSYVVATDTATYTPTSPLPASTTFTATITTGAADMYGNTLAANFVWTFTTSAVCAPPPPGLGTACAFGILAATPVVSSIGPTTITGGNVGIWPAASVTGFPPGTLTGTTHLGDAVAQQAQSDLTVAYNNAAGAAGGATVTADIGGQTLAPGVYKVSTTLGITGDLTLSGSASGVWIFQVGSALTTAAGPGNSRVLLTGGAVAKNVTWQIGSSATLGTGSTFAGNILAQDSITLGTGATLDGRALARTGAVSLDSNAVTLPPCP